MPEENIKPKVSIVLPVYNVGKFLPYALDSLINQTLKEIEIICIDDKSTDNSLEIIKEYSQKDKRIIVIEQEQNKGEVVAKHKGALIAKADYIGTLDPDDWVTLNYYEEMYKSIIENQADMTYCSYQITKENGKLKNKFMH